MQDMGFVLLKIKCVIIQNIPQIGGMKSSRSFGIGRRIVAKIAALRMVLSKRMAVRLS
ncbi:MAG: hypothetical protein RLZZ628_3755 [Bacteroidota bacterium]|jgi:hypothetical protein